MRKEKVKQLEFTILNSNIWTQLREYNLISQVTVTNVTSHNKSITYIIYKLQVLILYYYYYVTQLNIIKKLSYNFRVGQICTNSLLEYQNYEQQTWFYFISIFYLFYFIFFILNLSNRVQHDFIWCNVSMILVTVTLSHDTEKSIEDSEIDNVI